MHVWLLVVQSAVCCFPDCCEGEWPCAASRLFLQSSGFCPCVRSCAHRHHDADDSGMENGHSFIPVISPTTETGRITLLMIVADCISFLMIIAGGTPPPNRDCGR